MNPAELIEFKRRLHGMGPPRSSAGLIERLGQLYAPDHTLHAPCPIDDCVGLAEQCERFWKPLLTAFPDLERRDDILMAGPSEVAPVGSGWAAHTGHYLGTFTAPWLGIPPTGQAAWIRFGAFHRVASCVVHETYLILDIPGLMQQAGVCPLPPANAVDVLVPGPAAHDGVMLAAQDPAETAGSLACVHAMIRGLHNYDRNDLASMGMAKFWHPDMMWYGPAGVGSTRGVTGFQRHYQKYFLDAFPDRVGGNHKARIAEGAYVATTGWPSVTATDAGGWLGRPPTGQRIGLRVMDWWRRTDAMLHENWVFIDLGDYLRQTGFDLFGHLPK